MKSQDGAHDVGQAPGHVGSEGGDRLQLVN